MICGWGLGELLGSLLSELLGCWGDVAALLIIAGFAVLACADRFKARRRVDSLGGWFLGCEHKNLVVPVFHRPALAPCEIQSAQNASFSACRHEFVLPSGPLCVADFAAAAHGSHLGDL